MTNSSATWLNELDVGRTRVISGDHLVPLTVASATTVMVRTVEQYYCQKGSDHLFV